MITLRPHQERAVAEVRDAMRTSRRVLLVVPTGGGKTATASVLIHSAHARGRRSLFLVHRREIVRDTHRRLVAAGVPCGLVMAGEPTVDAPVQVASVQTIAAREAYPAADLVVWDEAHHVAAETYGAIREQYPAAYHLGLTATPERSDGAPLGDAFERLVVGATVSELTAAGYLAPVDVVAPGRRLQGALSMDPVEAVTVYGSGPTVVFAESVRESKRITGDLVLRGLRAAHIDGTTPARQRDATLAGYAAGRLDVLCNVAVLTEGWDAPRTAVCVLARGCGSVGTYLQMVGRALRVAEGKRRARIVDLAGVVHEHGMPDEDRRWSLTEGSRRRAEERPWLSQCGACGAVFLGRRAPHDDRGRRVCVRCAAPLGDRDPAEIRAEKLAAVDRRALVSAETKRREWERLTGIARMQGYKPGWAWHMFKSRFGHEPARTWRAA